MRLEAEIACQALKQVGYFQEARWDHQGLQQSLDSLNLKHRTFYDACEPFREKLRAVHGCKPVQGWDGNEPSAL